MTYATTFEQVRDALRAIGYDASVDGPRVIVPGRALSMSAGDDPNVLLALYRNDPPVEGDGDARWGVQIEYPDHLTRYQDDDPTLGEGWALPQAATLDASADRLAAIMLGYAADTDVRPAGVPS